MKKDPRVDDYVHNAAPFAKPLLQHLRKIVHASCPDAIETIKWDSPFYTYQGKIVCGMGTFKEHCKFWVKNWKSIKKDQGLPAETAIEQMLHIYKVADLPSARMIKSLLKLAQKFNEPGSKPSTPKIRFKKPPVKTPTELLQALRAKPKALATYEAFSPSVQRHYVDWITSAKTISTREKRLAATVRSVTAGKTRHWT